MSEVVFQLRRRIGMKILLAFDGSRYSVAAASFVQALDIGSRGEVTIVTVIPEHVFLGGHTLISLPGGSAQLKIEVRQAQEDRALELLSKASESLVPHGLKVETVVRRGSPADQIMKACRDIKADLAVLGFKGTSEAPEFLLGSVAQKVMKYAPCSVLIAKKETKTVSRVLAPLDGSRYSDEVVQFLLEMPLPHGAEVLLMAVVQSFAAAFVRTYTLDRERDRQILAELQKAEEEAGERLMMAAEGEFHKARYRVLTTVTRGDPSREILREADRQDVDLIALGAKGLTGVRGFLLGSVAQRVARYAKCSVLIVRPSRVYRGTFVGKA
jgi:nucleotide-binding universal stress UspA family protein